MRSILFPLIHQTALSSCKSHCLLGSKRFYNTGLLRKTTALPDKVGLRLSKDRKGNSVQHSLENDLSINKIYFLYGKKDSGGDKDDLIKARRAGDILQVPGSTYG